MWDEEFLSSAAKQAQGISCKTKEQISFLLMYQAIHLPCYELKNSDVSVYIRYINIGTTIPLVDNLKINVYIY